jgi:EamA-like transporter family protein
VTPATGPSPHNHDTRAPGSVTPSARVRAGALTAATLVAFASNSILCRLALSRAEIDPATFTTVRLLSGATVLAALAAIRSPQRWMAGGNWGSAAALAIYAVAFSYAYVSLEAGIGALLLFGAVQATMILTALSRGERASRGEWIGHATALGGLIYLVSPGLTAPPPVGAALMIAAGAAWGVYTLRGRGSVAPVLTTASNFVRSAPLAVAVLGAPVSDRGSRRDCSTHRACPRGDRRNPPARRITVAAAGDLRRAHPRRHRRCRHEREWRAQVTMATGHEDSSPQRFAIHKSQIINA